jgi:hypothetical protein
MKREEARLSSISNAARSASSAGFSSAHQVPEQPVGPRRLKVNLAGTFQGWGLGLVLVHRRGRSRPADYRPNA